MTIEIENESNFKAALAEGCNLFLGSGFPTLAMNHLGHALPTGTGLIEELGTEFNIESPHAYDLAQLATVIAFDRKAELTSFLRHRFSVHDYDPRYCVLPRYNIAAIFTTNIDDLLFKVYGQSSERYLNDIDTQGPSFNDRDAVDYIALHGSIRHDHRSLRFTTLEIAGAYAAESDRWQYLQQRLDRMPTIFWGYSLKDAGTLQALTPNPAHVRHSLDKWIVLPHPTPQEMAYFTALGFQIVRADTNEMLDYLLRMASTSIIKHPPSARLATHQQFPEYAIPDPGTVPVRPILEFYLGSPPQWSDLFSGQLHHTIHFNSIRNSINSGKNTIIIGIPASGKTTLLMDVACSTTVDGHKLFLDHLSIENARMIASRLAGDEAVIFVDNFADSVEGFSFLLSIPNVRLVGAERDYHFEIISHLLPFERFNPPINVTELGVGDLQQIMTRVPESIIAPGTPRRSRTTISLFEAIESRLAQPSLRSRFGSVLAHLKREDIRLHDLLIMLSYVDKCRTPVSMDMLIAFTRGTVKDYREIYALIRKLGMMVSEYSGTSYISLLEDQDYFVTRSTIIGEAVLSQSSPTALKTVITRFHKNISSYRICQYDTFRRSAYDNDLMLRAFEVPEEGLAFYKGLFLKDSSAYMLQQAALFASKKRRFQEAFELIDQALTLSGNKIWSIRNSWAVILFNANIGHFDDPLGRRTLYESMEILQDCFVSDRRKPYHAISFARQALRLWNDYQAEESKEYLRTSLTWLREELSRSPWNWQIHELLPDIRNAVTDFTGS